MDTNEKKQQTLNNIGTQNIQKRSKDSGQKRQKGGQRFDTKHKQREERLSRCALCRLSGKKGNEANKGVEFERRSRKYVK